ncbi:MAG: (Fe-S)-binding protein [Magnetococcales bacterium]|nr:(Fe-S)-binding protein [Magnetococcales bacterium]NGZ26407.1 (Fe-S)-binding protein [Magnetococcales bacterium]
MNASLQRGLDAFRRCLDAPTASFFSSCVHCGLCAEACLFYTETGDPNYAPINRLAPLQRLWFQEYTLLGRFLSALGLTKPVTHDELAQWSPLVYDSCTLCGRCALVCPMGIDLVYMIRREREGLAVSGHAPAGLVGATTRNVNKGSAMGVTLDTLRAQIHHQEALTGIPVPMDVQDADYLVLLSSMEIVQFPEYIGALSKIFQRAKVKWTLSSQAFEATNSGIQIGIPDIARQIVMRTVTVAEKLGVKVVICPECGHGFRALRWEGEDLIGRRYGFRVQHILEVLDELHQEGRLPLRTQDQDARPLTYHDPCQIARRGGVVEQPRNLLRKISSDYREMAETGTMNWCCGGGGGVSALEQTVPLRRQVFRRKKAQIESLGVHTLVTACANCRMVMEEDLEVHGMDVEVIGLTEMVADHLEE